MKRLLWAGVVLALEALVLWGLFAVVDAGLIFPASVAQALLVGTVSLMMWLGLGLLVAGGAGVFLAGGRVAGMQRQAELVVAQALVEAEESAPLAGGPPRALPPE